MENKMVPSESSCSTTAQSENLAIKEVVDELFHGLSNDEIQILLARFGIGEPAGQSVDELAQRLHITTDQVLAIEATALRVSIHASCEATLEEATPPPKALYLPEGRGFNRSDLGKLRHPSRSERFADIC
ncbi:hypothetical protein [Acidithiobacillus ferrooxidans]|uniref:hypothetical protein n=1 Tax=Acidithiobacillus ferrooxidans TaxID=920 RepID=UPI000AF21E3D|nr:hypothetical protein [Acidithiobacillus ferrooxidans]